MKIGILGTGNIANVVSRTLVQMDDIQCWAVASREKDKAADFAGRYGFRRAYGNYEALLEDPEVELVYIATPHTQHFEWLTRCIESGKPVLSEKAFTLNADQACRVKASAESRGVFAAEAIWTRYMPSRTIIGELLDSGLVGPVHALTADLCYNVSHSRRTVDPALGGGALLDVGIYGINFAMMHFGCRIDRAESSVIFSDTGVDAMENISLLYGGGRIAAITAGIYARSDRRGIFYGEKGYIEVDNINNPRSVRAYDASDRLLRQINMPPQISGYEYEFRECARALREGRTETWSMPLAESVRVLELLDSIRSQWGFRYPQETE